MAEEVLGLRGVLIIVKLLSKCFYPEISAALTLARVWLCNGQQPHN